MRREIRIMLDVSDEEDYARAVNAVWATVLAVTGDSRAFHVQLDDHADLNTANLWWEDWTEWTEADRF